MAVLRAGVELIGKHRKDESEAEHAGPENGSQVGCLHVDRVGFLRPMVVVQFDSYAVGTDRSIIEPEAVQHRQQPGGYGEQSGKGRPFCWAEHPRSVALKLLNREVSTEPELVRRFEREADVVAQLEPPG